MAKGLIHGENGDMLQMESVFLIKVLSRFSPFELFHLVRWKGAFPSAFGAAPAALACGTASTVLAEDGDEQRRGVCPRAAPEGALPAAGGTGAFRGAAAGLGAPTGLVLPSGSNICSGASLHPEVQLVSQCCECY